MYRLTGGRRLGRDAARAFRDAERGRAVIHVSAVSLFEIALLVERGRIRAPAGWDGWMATLHAAPGLAIEPFCADDVASARGLGAISDPFDRMIAATALRLGARLITADEEITESPLVRVIW